MIEFFWSSHSFILQMMKLISHCWIDKRVGFFKKCVVLYPFLNTHPQTYPFTYFRFNIFRSSSILRILFCFKRYFEIEYFMWILKFITAVETDSTGKSSLPSALNEFVIFFFGHEIVCLLSELENIL